MIRVFPDLAFELLFRRFKTIFHRMKTVYRRDRNQQMQSRYSCSQSQGDAKSCSLSDVACEQAPKEIDTRLRRKTTKGTIHYENKSEKYPHNFAPVSRPRLAPTKINRGGGISGVLTSARALRLASFHLTVHRDTNSKDTGRKNKTRLCVRRRTQKWRLNDQP